MTSTSVSPTTDRAVPAAPATTAGWTPVDLRRIRVGFGDADQLYFHLRPVCGGWEKAFGTRTAADRQAGTRRLALSDDGGEYILTWSDAPQDIGAAMEQVDDLVAEVNEAYVRDQEAADDGR
jgi:hypothetical protein